MTDGYITVKKPVKLMGTKVEGLYLEFKNGVLNKWDAKKGKDVFAQFINSDENANKIGEFALVDETSPIAKSNKIFNSALYDENASCHIALGSGYTSCLSSGSSQESIEKSGCNQSIVHEDFMIGLPETKIIGYKANQETLIMEKGLFKI